MRVLRSLVYPAANRGFARRLADHAAFAAGALATRPRRRPGRCRRGRDPPLFTAAAGRRLRAAEARRAWRSTSPTCGPRARSSSARCARAAGGRGSPRARPPLLSARRADHRADAGIVERARRPCGGPGKVVQVPPAVDLERFAASARAHASRRARAELRARLRVLYAGTLGLAQGLPTLIEAAALAGPRGRRADDRRRGPGCERLSAPIAMRSRPGERAPARAPSRPSRCRASTQLRTPASCRCATCRSSRRAAHASCSRCSPPADPRSSPPAARRPSSCATPEPGSSSRRRTRRRSRRRSAYLQAAPARRVAMGPRGRAHARRFDRARRSAVAALLIELAVTPLNPRPA